MKLEHGQPRLDLGREATSVEQLALEHGKEALAQGVVVGVADGAHRRPDPPLAAPESKGADVY
jgi:hypothetical protein